MRKINRRIVLFWFLLLMGFLAGIVLPEIIKMNSGTYSGFFSMYSIQRFQQQEIQMREVFLYILSFRMELLLFLWLSSFTKIGIWLHAGVGAWTLCTAGMLLRLFFMKEGVHGIFMFVCCLMPQWLLYGILWKRELQICMSEKKMYDAYRGRLWLTFLNLTGLCLGGCLCEAWIGMQFQKKILEFFL